MTHPVWYRFHFSVKIGPKWLLPLLLVGLAACGNPRNHSGQPAAQNNVEKAEAVQLACAKVFQHGEAAICLPLIDGMQECSSHPIIDSSFQLINPTHQPLLGYYLAQADYDAIDSLRGRGMGYMTVLTMHNDMFHKGTEFDLDAIFQDLSNLPLAPILGTVKEYLKDLRNDLELGTTYLLEKLPPRTHTRSLITITSANIEGRDLSVISVVSLVLVREKIIRLTYFDELTDQASLDAVKKKTAHIEDLFVASNL